MTEEEEFPDFTIAELEEIDEIAKGEEAKNEKSADEKKTK